MGSDSTGTLETLRGALAARTPRRYPRVRGMVRAAVAVVLVPTPEGLGTVLIGRPVRASDRWSGDVAFPGGLARPYELDVEAARREAEEEVGLRLGEPLTHLSDRLSLAPGRTRPMRVRPVIFLHEAALDLRADPREVAMMHVAPLNVLARSSRVRLVRKIGPIKAAFPAIPIGDHSLWGLTLSVIEELLTLSAITRT